MRAGNNVIKSNRIDITNLLLENLNTPITIPDMGRRTNIGVSVVRNTINRMLAAKEVRRTGMTAAGNPLFVHATSKITAPAMVPSGTVATPRYINPASTPNTSPEFWKQYSASSQPTWKGQR